MLQKLDKELEQALSALDKERDSAVSNLDAQVPPAAASHVLQLTHAGSHAFVWHAHGGRACMLSSILQSYCWHLAAHGLINLHDCVLMLLLIWNGICSVISVHDNRHRKNTIPGKHCMDAPLCGFIFTCSS